MLPGNGLGVSRGSVVSQGLRWRVLVGRSDCRTRVLVGRSGWTRASGTLRTDGALRGESGGARAEAPGLTLTSGPLSTFEDGGEEGWVRS